jgi:alpha-N-acetylglucosamine transferase
MDKNFKLSSEPKHDNAYVWLLMKGDSYLPGIVTSLFSVIRTNPNADLVVMTTDDVSSHAKSILLKYASHIFDIQYLSVLSKPLKTQNQQRMYEKWIGVSYTKWQMLALPYKKAIFVDGDTIHMSNTDELFDLPAPAAPFASPYMQPLGKIPSYIAKSKNGPDGYPKHKSIVTQAEINNMLHKHGNLLTANMVLLEPSKIDHKKYVDMVKSMEPFGFQTCNSGFDEQSIAYFYTFIKKKNWTALHQIYNYVAWKDRFILKGVIPHNIHYISEGKPWVYAYDRFDDVLSWYKFAALAIIYGKITAQDIFLKESDIEGAVRSGDTFVKKFANVPTLLDLNELGEKSNTQHNKHSTSHNNIDSISNKINDDSRSLTGGKANTSYNKSNVTTKSTPRSKSKSHNKSKMIKTAQKTTSRSRSRSKSNNKSIKSPRNTRNTSKKRKTVNKS